MLDEDIIFTKEISPICLPSYDDNGSFAPLIDTNNCYATGWGRTGMEISSTTQCYNIYHFDMLIFSVIINPFPLKSLLVKIRYYRVKNAIYLINKDTVI